MSYAGAIGCAGHTGAEAVEAEYIAYMKQMITEFLNKQITPDASLFKNNLDAFSRRLATSGTVEKSTGQIHLNRDLLLANYWFVLPGNTQAFTFSVSLAIQIYA